MKIVFFVSWVKLAVFLFLETPNGTIELFLLSVKYVEIPIN